MASCFTRAEVTDLIPGIKHNADTTNIVRETGERTQLVNMKSAAESLLIIFHSDSRLP